MVCEIYIAQSAGGPMRRVSDVQAVAEKGLEGDRYCLGVGSFSRWPDSGRAVTFIAAETLESIQNECGIDLSAGRTRRNIVTRGVDLETWKGRKFQLGGAIMRGSRVAAPCKYLERLTEPGVYAALKGRGGLRADILVSGRVREGDLLIAI